MPRAINYPPADGGEEEVSPADWVHLPSKEAARLEHRFQEGASAQPRQGHAGVSRQSCLCTWKGPILHTASSHSFSLQVLEWCTASRKVPCCMSRSTTWYIQGLTHIPQREEPGQVCAMLGACHWGVNSTIWPVPAPPGSKQQGDRSIPPRQPGSQAPFVVRGRYTVSHTDAAVVWAAARACYI